jgi:uncharacterized membrane protein HdeD (DUF308 family)
MSNVASALMGAVSLASLVAGLFFFKFWRRTSDEFFLFFAAAFVVDAVSRFVIAVTPISNEAEPMAYVPRLLTFGLILLAIIRKNTGKGRH